MQIAKWMLKAVLTGGAAAACWAAHGEGLTPTSDALLWGRWQARMAVGSAAPAWRTSFDRDERPGLKVSAVSLMGDYYFSRSATVAGGIASGFRATSGLIVGPRTALWTARPSAAALGSIFSVDRRLFDASASLPGSDAWADSGALPYLGVGYSGLSLRGGWSVSADLGLVAQSPGAVKLGRMLGGTQGLDDLLRDLRLSPVIQLGVSYSF
jgi:hypothetical protein